MIKGLMLNNKENTAVRLCDLNHLRKAGFITRKSIVTLPRKSFSLAATFSVFFLRKSNPGSISSAAVHVGDLPLWNVCILITGQKALKHLQQLWGFFVCLL